MPKTVGDAGNQRQELADIQDVFQFYDTHGDGRVQSNQLGLCLRSMGFCPSEAQLAKLTAQHNPEDRISMEQFLPMVNSMRKQGARDRTEEEMNAFLLNLDRDSTGSVGLSDLRHFLTSCGEPLSLDEFEQIVAASAGGNTTTNLILLDRENEGRLAIVDLVNTLTNNGGGGTK